jgi:hypothetical protein
MNVTITRDAAFIHSVVAERVTKQGFVFVDALLQCVYRVSDSYYYLSAECNLRTPQGDEATASLSDIEIRAAIYDHLTANGYGCSDDLEVIPGAPMKDGELTESFSVRVHKITIVNQDQDEAAASFKQRDISAQIYGYLTSLGYSSFDSFEILPLEPIDEEGVYSSFQVKVCGSTLAKNNSNQ